MHDDEIPTDVPLVRRLIVQQFPQWAQLKIRPVESAGTDNALYRLGEELTVRLPRIHWAVDNVDKEVIWLPILATQLPFPVPVPLAKGRPAEGFPYPWSVCRWIQGENPRVGSLSQAEDFARELAQFIVALRSIDSAGGPACERGVPLAQRDAPTRKAIEELRGTVDTDAVSAAWESTLQVPIWNGPPVWLHGDLSALNLLCTDGRLCGVLDFGMSGIGDPAVDLIPAWTLLPKTAREPFRKATQVDDATWRRARGWALSISLIQLPYYRDRNPTLAELARRTIEQVLEEPS